MGEYAEMMLDGTCCEACGEFIGNPVGYPRYCCKACEPDGYVSEREYNARQRHQFKSMGRSNHPPVKPSTAKPFPCPNCNRSFRTENALRDHGRDRHSIAKAQEGGAS